MGYDTFAAIMVVTDTEEAGLRVSLKDLKEVPVEGDAQRYYETFFERGGVRHRVVCARQDEMGMTAAGVLATRLISLFRPRYLIMCGIAAGIDVDETCGMIYGDVVVADMVWNYSNGKFVPSEMADICFGDVGFQARPTVIPQLETIRPYVEAAVASSENQTHVHIGPMATGTAVVATQHIRDRQVLSQYEHTRALDMEAYAVAYAAAHAPAPKPTSIIIKSVCDFADSRKDDRFQKFAACTSAEFAKFLYENFLPDGEDGPV